MSEEAKAREAYREMVADIWYERDVLQQARYESGQHPFLDAHLALLKEVERLTAMVRSMARESNEMDDLVEGLEAENERLKAAVKELTWLAKAGSMTEEGLDDIDAIVALATDTKGETDG